MKEDEDVPMNQIQTPRGKENINNTVVVNPKPK
jgi:hypothetical protein